MSLTEEEWEKAAGLTCPSCGEETLRLIDGKCSRCCKATIARREARMEDQAERRHVKRLLQAGTVSRQDLKEGHY